MGEIRNNCTILVW